MKKIVALVLGLALALSLCTVAFAGTIGTDLGVRDTSDKTNKITTPTTLTYVDAVAPKKDSDGNFTADGVIGHYEINNTKYLQVASQADADVIVYAADAKTVVMYLSKIGDANYFGEGTVFANFGTKCGQVNQTPAAKTTYYTVNDGTDNVYMTVSTGGKYIMVGNKMVMVADAGFDTTDVVKHLATPVVADGKTTGYKCSICGMAATKAANWSLVPKAAQATALADSDGVSYWYFASAGTPAAAGTTAGVASPKTFDAGIAMYAGLALMSVAGSAVVIGKKKEF